MTTTKLLSFPTDYKKEKEKIKETKRKKRWLRLNYNLSPQTTKKKKKKNWLKKQKKKEEDFGNDPKNFDKSISLETDRMSLEIKLLTYTLFWGHGDISLDFYGHWDYYSLLERWNQCDFVVKVVFSFANFWYFFV